MSELPDWKQASIAKKIEEMQRELRRLDPVMTRMKMGASAKYGSIAPGDVKAMEGWMLSLIESYVTLTRLTNGSVASASAVARLKNLAEKHVDWQHG